MTYKERVSELANQYWRARWVHDVNKAKAIYDAMGKVPADALPPGIHRPLVDLADRLSLNERARSNDTAGVPWICRGNWPFDAYDLQITDEGWVEMEGYANGFNRVWHNESLDATFSYCEGDLTLCIYWPHEAYLLGVGAERDFYRRMGA